MRSDFFYSLALVAVYLSSTVAGPIEKTGFFRRTFQIGNKQQQARPASTVTISAGVTTVVCPPAQIITVTLAQGAPNQPPPPVVTVTQVQQIVQAPSTVTQTVSFCPAPPAAPAPVQNNGGQQNGGQQNGGQQNGAQPVGGNVVAIPNQAPVKGGDVVTITQTIRGDAGNPGQVITATKTVQAPAQSNKPSIQNPPPNQNSTPPNPAPQNPAPQNSAPPQNQPSRVQVVTVTQVVTGANPGVVSTVVATKTINPNQGSIVTVTSTVAGGQVVTNPAQVVTVINTITAPGGVVSTQIVTATVVLQQNAGTINNNINNGQIINNNGRIVVVQLTAPASTATITSIRNGVNVTQTVVQPPSTILKTVTMTKGAPQASGINRPIPIGAEIISNTTIPARPDEDADDASSGGILPPPGAIASGILRPNVTESRIQPPQGAIQSGNPRQEAVKPGLLAPSGAVETGAISPSPIAQLPGLPVPSASNTPVSSQTAIRPSLPLGRGAASPSPIALASNIPRPLASPAVLPTPVLPPKEEAIKSGILPPNQAFESGRPIAKRADVTVEEVNAEGVIVVVVSTALGGRPIATPIAPLPQAPPIAAPLPPVAAPAPQQPVATPAGGAGRFPVFTGAPRVPVPGNGPGTGPRPLPPAATPLPNQPIPQQPGAVPIPGATIIVRPKIGTPIAGEGVPIPQLTGAPRLAVPRV